MKGNRLYVCFNTHGMQKLRPWLNDMFFKICIRIMVLKNIQRTIQLVSYLLLTIIVLYSCSFSSEYHQKGVNSVLQLAGNNKSEISKIINHFKDDSLKLKATYYLIGNMHDKIHLPDEHLIYFKTVFTLLDTLIPNHRDSLNYALMSVNDSLWKSAYTNFSKNEFQPKYVRDVESINSDLLIENIELAFYAWEKFPWNNHLTFNQFCEYILPYKCFNEKPEKFRKKILDSYQIFLDSLLSEKINDPVKVCSLVHEQIIKKSNWLTAKYPTTMSFSENASFMGGPCENHATHATYIMRALGVPVSLMYSPQDGNRGAGVHYFNTVLDTNNKHVPFQPGHDQPGLKINLPSKKRAKIHQVTYKEQSHTLSKYSKYKEITRKRFFSLLQGKSCGRVFLQLPRPAICRVVYMRGLARL